MKPYYSLLLLLCFMAGMKPAVAQEPDNPFFREMQFLFRVKQIDEFFERFNDDKNSFFRQNIARYYPKVKIDRRSLLKTLFDNENKNIKQQVKEQFIESVSSQRTPGFISFYNPDWYAEVICSFDYHRQPVTARIVLKVVTDSAMGSKWVISRIGCTQLSKTARPVTVPAPANPGKFISPISHTTNFAGLDRVFGDQTNIRAYLSKEFLNDTASLSFLDAWRNNELSFRGVQSVQYYFLQVAGWKFKVESCIKKKSLNTGWLITSLERSNTNTSVTKG